MIRSPTGGKPGYSAAHSRYFWGSRLYLLCAPDGMPIAFELAPANAPERDVAAQLLERGLQHGQTVIADEGFAGAPAPLTASSPASPDDCSRSLPAASATGSKDNSPAATSRPMTTESEAIT